MSNTNKKRQYKKADPREGAHKKARMSCYFEDFPIMEEFKPADTNAIKENLLEVIERREQLKEVRFLEACEYGEMQFFMDLALYSAPENKSLGLDVEIFEAGVRAIVEGGHLNILILLEGMVGKTHLWQKGHTLPLAAAYKQWKVLHYLLDHFDIRNNWERERLYDAMTEVKKHDTRYIRLHVARNLHAIMKKLREKVESSLKGNCRAIKEMYHHQ